MRMPRRAGDPAGGQLPGSPGRHEHLGFRTTCGREVAVGWLLLGGPDRPARRISLDIGHSPGRRDGTWAALTPGEARQLAAALLHQAAAAEQPAAPGGIPQPSGTAASPVQARKVIDSWK